MQVMVIILVFKFDLFCYLSLLDIGNRFVFLITIFIFIFHRNNKGESLATSYYYVVNPLTAVGAKLAHI